MSLSENNLIWIDLEMTGLDTVNDKIIEVAMIITDINLNVIAEEPVIAVHQSDETLEKMDSWNQSTHAKSGLIQRVKESSWDEEATERHFLEFLTQYVPKNASPMCGNSICQDRRFLFNNMPKLESFFHYRNLDVSTLNILVNRLRPDLLNGFSKSNAHQALQDIKDSIEELRHYYKYFLNLR